MSFEKRPCEGEIWTGPGGVRFAVLVNAEHFVTADPLVVYREVTAEGAADAEKPAYVCTLEAFLEFMRPTGKHVAAAADAARQAEDRSGEARNSAARTAADAGTASRGAAPASEKILTPEQAAFRDAVFSRGAARKDAAPEEEGEGVPFSEEEFMKSFFAAAGSDEQIAIINENWRSLTDRIVDNICIVLDLSVRQGSIDDRLIDLTGCLRTKSRFEGQRGRLRGE
ncbi:MAG: hypothetical protein IJG61_02650 [Lachnospiraceae bacterium]|nr:hypothetical protein [Lachnospiraceae bacterium]